MNDIISRADALKIIDDYYDLICEEDESISKSARLSLARYLEQKLKELKPVTECQMEMEV